LRPTPARRGSFYAPVECLESRKLLSISLTQAVGATDGGGNAKPVAGQIADEIVPGGVILRDIGGRLPMHRSGTRLEADPGNGGGLDVGSFDIVLNRGPNLTDNAAATNGFEAAAQFLESLFSDPVTVVVDAEIAPLDPGIIGSTGSVSFFGTYDEIRDLVVADRAGDESIAASLPTGAQLVVGVPPAPGNPYFIGGMAANRATLLALGVPPQDLDGQQSQFDPTVDVDMSITFSSTFAFDFDRSDGISPGQLDFVGVAIHEIAHGLGFTSEVDTVDFTEDNPAFPRVLFPKPLDLYAARFVPSPAGRRPGEFHGQRAHPRPGK
jgi:hypothetical protein